MIVTGDLYIGYDMSENGDLPTLVVGKRTEEGNITIIETFQGDEAKELYEKLTNKKG